MRCIFAVLCLVGCFSPATQQNLACAEGQLCPAGQTCSRSGFCVVPCESADQCDCRASEVVCDGLCIDPVSDPAYCGVDDTCGGGEQCGSDRVCSNGACQMGCESGLLACDGGCIDPLTDPGRCGASGACSGDSAGEACGDTETCEAGECTQFAASCLELFNRGVTLSGVYDLAPRDDGTSFAAYCDMESDGGGWTLVMKATDEVTFAYESAVWTGGGVIDTATPSLAVSPAVYEGFNTVVFSAVRLQPLASMGQPLVVTQSGTSMSNLFIPNVYIPSTAGRDTWKLLVPGSSLQPNCSYEGFNPSIGTSGGAPGYRVRIGILGNNENDCLTPDSFLGVGSGADTGTPAILVGNIARAGGDSGDADVPATVAIFVR